MPLTRSVALNLLERDSTPPFFIRERFNHCQERIVSVVSNLLEIESTLVVRCVANVLPTCCQCVSNLLERASTLVRNDTQGSTLTLKRRCTYRPSVTYLVVNRLLSLPLSLPLSLSRARALSCRPSVKSLLDCQSTSHTHTQISTLSFSQPFSTLSHSSQPFLKECFLAVHNNLIAAS